jgi:translation initiation factor IF-1
MRRILYSTLIVGAFSMAAAAAYAQQQDPPRQQPGTNAARNLRARVVRVDGNDRVVVRTQDNRDVILNVSPQTKYIVNGQPSRLTDLRVDQNINTVYTMDGDRYIVSQIQVGDNAAVGAPADNANARVFRGRVTKAFNNNQLTVKSQDGKEVVFMTRPNQQLAVTGKFTKIQEIPVGTDVQVTYTEQDNHWFIDSITIAPINANNDADSVQGTVVRIVGRDQVVVKTADGKEVTVYVAPQTTYRIDDQPAQFTDFQAGQNVRIVTETRDRRLFGRSILGTRRVR